MPSCREISLDLSDTWLNCKPTTTTIRFSCYTHTVNGHWTAPKKNTDEKCCNSSLLQGQLPDSPYQYQLLGLNLLCLLSQVCKSLLHLNLITCKSGFCHRTAWQNSTQSWRGCPRRRFRKMFTSNTLSASSNTSWRAAIIRYFC